MNTKIIYKSIKVILINILFNIGKIIDLLFSPIAILVNKRGYWYIEVKNSSLGHHLFEPVALAYKSKMYKDKKLVFLSKASKANVLSANILLSQIGEVRQDYSYFDFEYWLARNKFCGLRRSWNAKDGLDEFYRIHYNNVNSKSLIDLSKLLNFPKVKKTIKDLNPEQKPIVVWKPRIPKESDIYYSRSSSLKNIIPLIEKIKEQGYIIFSYIDPKLGFTYPGIINLALIEDRELRELSVFAADHLCKYAICGQTGGAISLQLSRKPLIIYDAAFPYTFFWQSPPTLLLLKSARYIDTDKPVRIETLINLKSQVEIKRKGIYFENNSSEELIKAFNELVDKVAKYGLAFPIDSYQINSETNYDVPCNQYNKYGYSQLSDTSFEIQKDLLWSSQQKSRKSKK